MDKNREVKAFFDETNKYLHKDFGVRVRREIVAEIVSSDFENKKIIDIGCGNGDVSLQFLSASKCLHFLDISDKMLHLVEQKIPDIHKSKVRFYNGDLEQLSIDEKYDIVIAFGLIMHVNSPENTLKRLAELLNENGLLITQYTNANHPIAIANTWLRKEKENYKINKINPHSFEKWISKLPLQILKSFSYSLLINGLGRLSNDTLYKFHKKTYTNAILSKLGMDKVYVLRKNK
ncbi:MAG: class I SAM-dependent methyltransferase [Bacteroidia bacterium]|jgi:ubiquinone/menaquinone biosynthesis C-methylase UbiE|nr:class I SAM-dependent methyltransferase [Bacteroidia bacterium]